MQTNLTEKIQKLLSLAQSNVEAEAKAAMLRAQALMAENDLSMEEVIAIAPEEEEAEEVRVDKGTDTIAYWQKLLASVISKNFRCQMFFRSYRNHRRDIVLVGMPKDVEVAQETMKFAFASANNCWKKYRKGQDYPSRRITEAAKKDFMIGFTRGLRDAFAEQVKEKAIVLVQNPKVDDYMNAIPLKGKEPLVQRNRVADANAEARGYEDGKRMNDTGGFLSGSASSGAPAMA